MRNEGSASGCLSLEQQLSPWAAKAWVGLSPPFQRPWPLEDKAGLHGQGESAALSADWGRKAEGTEQGDLRARSCLPTWRSSDPVVAQLLTVCVRG